MRSFPRAYLGKHQNIRLLCCLVTGSACLLFLLSDRRHAHSLTSVPTPSLLHTASLSTPPQSSLQDDALRRRAALLAPFTYPQLYPECSQLSLPPLPRTEPEQQAMQRSQSGEDLILFDMLYKGQGRRGVFLEIGAFDGERFSNSYYYEHALGWKGLLIEAHPMNAVKLFQANRPRSARFAAAACPLGEDGGAGSVVFSETGGEVAAAREAASPEFKEKWAGQLGQGNVSVPCVPLQLLIDSTGLWDVDLFSLDVEGSEWAVLSTVDLKVTNVRAFLVELDGSNPDKDDKVCLALHGGKEEFECERGEGAAGFMILVVCGGAEVTLYLQPLSRAMRSHSLTCVCFSVV